MNKYQSRPFVALLALVVMLTISACSGGSPTSPTPTQPGPGVNNSSLTIKVNANAGLPATGAITLFGPAPSTNAVKTVSIQNGLAVFSGLASGEYRYNVAPGFGYQPKLENMVSVLQGNLDTEVTLEPLSYGIQFNGAEADGRALRSGESLRVPTNAMSIKVGVMNGTGHPIAAHVRVFGDPNPYTVGMGTTGAIQPGYHEVNVTLPNFQACSEAGQCVDRSRLIFLYVGDYPFQGAAVPHTQTEFPLTYER